jgi:hypothetical protein
VKHLLVELLGLGPQFAVKIVNGQGFLPKCGQLVSPVVAT